MDDDIAQYALETSLGLLNFTVKINGKVLQENDSLLARCSMVRIQGEQGEDLKGAVGVIVRCSTLKALRQFTFECQWDTKSKVPRGRPECEAGLNGLRWTSDAETVMVATEDVAGLQHRLQRSQNMSGGLRRCLSELTPDLDHLVFSFKDDGFIIRLTEIPANESFQLHYAVAWNGYPESVSEGTWLAVSALNDALAQVTVDKQG